MDTPVHLQVLERAALAPPVRRALRDDSAELVDWYVTSASGGVGGFLGLSDVYRVSGNALQRGEVVPWSLVLKVFRMPADDADPSAWCYWKRELLAYQSGLLADLPGGIESPRCFGALQHPGGDSWLWLEHIQDEASGPWPLQRFASAARRLGAFSGAYLVGRPLPSYRWLSSGWFRSRVTDSAPAIAEFPSVLSHPLVSRAYPAEIAVRVIPLCAEVGWFLDTLDQLPQTFCHLDAHRRNLLLGWGLDGAERLVAIDWAYSGIASVGAELASPVAVSILTGEVDLSSIEELDHTLFASYIAGLQGVGWRGDTRVVRLGYTICVALHFVVGNLPYMIRGALDESSHAIQEELAGCPMPEFMDRVAGLHGFLLDRADEARQIVTEL